MPAKKKAAKAKELAIISKELAAHLYDGFMVIGDVWAETGAEVSDETLEYLAGKTFELATDAEWIPSDVYRLWRADPAFQQAVDESVETGDDSFLDRDFAVSPTETETETLIGVWLVKNDFAKAFQQAIAEPKEYIRGLAEAYSKIELPSQWEEPNPGQIMRRFRKASGMTNALVAKRSQMSLKTLERLIDGRSKALRYKNAISLCEFMRTVMKFREDKNPDDAAYFLSLDLMDIRWRRKQS
jgi:hypothetical protein